MWTHFADKYSLTECLYNFPRYSSYTVSVCVCASVSVNEMKLMKLMQTEHEYNIMDNEDSPAIIGYHNHTNKGTVNCEKNSNTRVGNMN